MQFHQSSFKPDNQNVSIYADLVALLKNNQPKP